jgi:hypothetical protein
MGFYFRSERDCEKRHRLSAYVTIAWGEGGWREIVASHKAVSACPRTATPYLGEMASPQPCLLLVASHVLACLVK